jgi:hydroxyethylthiazole kinase-like uncharacterized protein yjeF
MLGAGSRVLVLAGPGNNGGDAFVVARHLAQSWHAVDVVFPGDAGRLPPDAAQALDALRACRVTPTAALAGPITHDLIVDGLFGIGLRRDLDGEYAALIACVAASGRPVLALDIPSGLDADTGRVLGCAVRAARTITFIATKPGLHTLDGPDHCGTIEIADLGLGAAASASASGTLIDATEVARLLARHPGGLQLKANTIGDDVARALTEPKLEQQRLWLHLPELSPTTARFLAQRTGIVSLILQRIPVEAAAALLAHRGPVVINHPEYYRRPPQLSPTSLEILKSSWGIGLPLGAFSTPSLFFTWGATGVSRTSIIALWWLFGVGTLAIIAAGLSLRRVGRHASVESPAMIERSAWNSMQTMRYASLTCSLALMLIAFTRERFVLPWQHFYADERGDTLPPFMVMEGSGVVLFLVPLLLWLLSLVACGKTPVSRPTLRLRSAETKATQAMWLSGL